VDVALTDGLEGGGEAEGVTSGGLSKSGFQLVEDFVVVGGSMCLCRSMVVDREKQTPHERERETMRSRGSRASITSMRWEKLGNM